MGAADHPGSGQSLGLMEAEHRHAIRVGIVVSDRERFQFVGLVSDVVARDPLSRAAKGLPIA